MNGLVLALASAALFGTATPASKLLLQSLDPVQLAGLLYAGAAIGVAPWSFGRRRRRRPLDARNAARLAGAVLFGGIAGPVLFLLGLRHAAAGSASLLLNAEVAMTAVLGVWWFGEALGVRGWIGVALILTAGVVLAGYGGWPSTIAATCIAAACVCWALDNNLTATIDGVTPSETTFWKAAIAGTTNLVLGIALQPFDATWRTVVVALAVGALSYGASIALYIAAAQQQGAIRAQSVFAAAPFVGAILSWLVLREPIATTQLLAGALFLAAVGLLALDRHSHVHRHDATAHVHQHRHDDGHHDHQHASDVGVVWHSHWHEHAEAEHTHPHVADLHHRHGGR